MKNAWIRWAFGAVIGIVLALPALGNVLVFFGFWGSMMFILPPLAAAVLFVAGVKRRDVSRLAGIAVASAIGFMPVFWWLTLDPGEGYPISALLVGAWMAAWIAALLSGFIVGLQHRLGRHYQAMQGHSS